MNNMKLFSLVASSSTVGPTRCASVLNVRLRITTITTPCLLRPSGWKLRLEKKTEKETMIVLMFGLSR